MAKVTGTVWGLYDPNYTHFKINMYRWQIETEKYTAFSKTIFSRRASAKRALQTFCTNHRINLTLIISDERSNTEFIT